MDHRCSVQVSAELPPKRYLHFAQVMIVCMHYSIMYIITVNITIDLLILYVAEVIMEYSTRDASVLDSIKLIT